MVPTIAGGRIRSLTRFGGATVLARFGPGSNRPADPRA
jgi:hypothetical protein